MSTLHDALVQYVAIRRALGSKLQEPARTLGQFVDFLDSQGVEFITTELVLRWAMQPKDVQRATWAWRLSMVRRFAAWLSAADSRTQVPPHRLIDGRRRRNPPHIFTGNEVKQLMVEAARLRSPKRFRAHTYKTLIGLLATSGLRPGEVLTLARPDADPRNEIRKIPLRPHPRDNPHGSYALCQTPQ
jgi:site-specific recombinase XerD